MSSLCKWDRAETERVSESRTKLLPTEAPIQPLLRPDIQKPAGGNEQATEVKRQRERAHQESVRISPIFESQRKPQALDTNCVIHA